MPPTLSRARSSMASKGMMIATLIASTAGFVLSRRW
jgi:hypothetical protein